MLPGTANVISNQKASVLISGLEPLLNHEQYNIELSWPVHDANIKVPADALNTNNASKRSSSTLLNKHGRQRKSGINWLTDNAAYDIATGQKEPHQLATGICSNR